MANDRIERFSKIKTWLGPVFEQRPSPHTILQQMLTDEQALLLRLINKSKPWALVSKTLTTVAGQSTYDIAQPISAYQDGGKVYYVVRGTGSDDTPFIPIPYDDFSSLDYGNMPPSVNSINEGIVEIEKISFYRKDAQDQTYRAVIQPVPQEVLTYTIWYFVGGIDRSQALLTSKGPLTELSDYLDLRTTIALLPDAMWSTDDAKNDAERARRLAGLQFQLGDINREGTLENTVDKYIRDINAPKTMDLGNWND